VGFDQICSSHDETFAFATGCGVVEVISSDEGVGVAAMVLDFGEGVSEQRRVGYYKGVIDALASGDGLLAKLSFVFGEEDGIFLGCAPANGKVQRLIYDGVWLLVLFVGAWKGHWVGGGF
jgi:hypothetical protein